MNPSIAVRALLAAAALLAAGPAHALSTETTTLSGFQIFVSDLDPSDGVAPTLWLDPQALSVATAGVRSAQGAATGWSQQGASTFGAVSVSGQLDGSGGAASFSGDPFAGGAQIMASAQGGSGTDIGLGGAFVQGPPGDYSVLLLGPHARVTFFGTVTLDWSASNPGAAAYGEVDLSFYGAPGSDVNVDVQQYVTGGYYNDGFGPPVGSSLSEIAAFYDNDSDQTVALAYEISVFANASDSELALPPVDEPASWALLLAGAALLWGWYARRMPAARRRRRDRGVL